MSAKEQYKNGVARCQPSAEASTIEVNRSVHPIGAFATVRVGEVVLSLLRTVGIDSLGNRVAVDAEGFGGVRNTLLVSRKCLLDVELFKLVEGFIQEDVSVEHVFNYCF